MNFADGLWVSSVLETLQRAWTYAVLWLVKSRVLRKCGGLVWSRFWNKAILLGIVCCMFQGKWIYYDSMILHKKQIDKNKMLHLTFESWAPDRTYDEWIVIPILLFWPLTDSIDMIIYYLLGCTSCPVAGMDEFSVISQHHSVTSLRRTMTYHDFEWTLVSTVWTQNYTNMISMSL